MIVVCAWCPWWRVWRKIRWVYQEGPWRRVSHGICPGCIKRYFAPAIKELPYGDWPRPVRREKDEDNI